MVIVTLRLIDGSRARELMDAHNAWIRSGFDDGVFLAVGSLEGGPGGAILTHGESLADVERRVRADPFVVHGVAEPTLVAFSPSATDPRLDFLRS